MKKYYVTVNGVKYEVEVEEVNGDFESNRMESKQINKEKIGQVHTEKKDLKEEYKESKVDEDTSISGMKIESPMPGTIIKVNVNVNDTVNKGDLLFILEAMKMENEIVAPSSGTVRKINVQSGESVNSGTLLAIIG